MIQISKGMTKIPFQTLLSKNSTKSSQMKLVVLLAKSRLRKTTTLIYHPRSSIQNSNQESISELFRHLMSLELQV